MRQVPEGRLITIREIREELAKKHNADFACPMTTGIFAWIAAHAAEEAREAGEERPTPYWRTLKSGGELNPKYPGGIDALKTRLESEGHAIRQRGRKVYVDNFERALVAESPERLNA